MQVSKRIIKTLGKKLLALKHVTMPPNFPLTPPVHDVSLGIPQLSSAKKLLCPTAVWLLFSTQCYAVCKIWLRRQASCKDRMIGLSYCLIMWVFYLNKEFPILNLNLHPLVLFCVLSIGSSPRSLREAVVKVFSEGWWFTPVNPRPMILDILYISFIYVDYLPVFELQIVHFWVMLPNSMLVL